MAASDPSVPAKAGFGVACAACCSIPMLLLAGVVSVVGVLTFGLTVGAVAVVAWATWAFWRRRLPVVGGGPRAVIVAVGTAVAVTGMAVAWNEPAAGRPMIIAGITLLAGAALLSLSRSSGSPSG